MSAPHCPLSLTPDNVAIFLFERTFSLNHIVLYQPQIPQNTGNIARTCAATNSPLHLIHPLGFPLDDKKMKRAGLDYWDQLEIFHYESLEDFLSQQGHQSLYPVTKFAEATYAEKDYQTGNDAYFIFGREDTGLPADFLQDYRKQAIRIPMNDDHVRSLNVSNAVCMVVYEALRQQNFVGLETVHHYEQDKIK
ncbi:tRNA (uridine(34)/cytosine(34)/5-carboxymethylaminomethyluridine(34)-2'-O)-methyltransferase TrmL [Streptococcus sp. NLN76]|uniref:tRNA (uridine(34)/cytosine(34)/5- carboxymethylaminomethyluridine(34)-2'-O)- methyltransferase TrmL n=1 Tax=Streptococcus sp. NLN76 TaxID=2822800 RepID=UPI0018A95BF3|nr:tRNA (uridine(34)/cytosine(34)/5-carboxymethylaminomethyluridine(34)-2'-O)-methyltransferase TrmL [Streptococcus sp. NLN76]MBF8970102.1 tRNA (uridine(34)/cytosine(34)/5-carboxymethylaminomethyluridine(34)-2'-O)-methyltransferase TrmL [Streptococcus sp. NLN76]